MDAGSNADVEEHYEYVAHMAQLGGITHQPRNITCMMLVVLLVAVVLASPATKVVINILNSEYMMYLLTMEHLPRQLVHVMRQFQR